MPSNSFPGPARQLPTKEYVGEARCNRTSGLEPRLDVEIRARGFLRIDALGEINANETVHERRADPGPAQRTPWMREVAATPCPTEIGEYDLAESRRAAADLRAGQPVRMTDCRTGPLPP